ncbi:16S rRNA (cytidine(1402)-2'-O)-methyltransferase [Desulfotomaculum copahuensis]|uniref:Ribosomal RNA small subunit methyltransferase I n=1 Tax=Desulfotomaculum copahuensis TaxID=1838280 RepID=A0A1B7LI77_9FIRM|nr:16S rRNA (cytidine(1402)-2'-O)-methyltransferase [Desulfotomaculum copahuensis]OAT86124.1 16S rRNA (cytidine(1402)-2'-O)-methyltransferase [Desulfotomaculum copahuensis]
MDGEHPGWLYLCATPIGNLEDITLRVLRILREVDLIAAEDTRHTRKLLSHYGIHTPLTSYHEHNRREKGEYLLGLLRSGRRVALVSDAGMPGISDPGQELVAAALGSGAGVVPLPGASAALTALVASGLPAERFCFEGFLPAGGRLRRQRLAELAAEARTVIIYEAPHRLRQTLADLLDVLGNRSLAVARELTKQYEQIWRGTLDGAAAYFQEHPPRGEFTLVVAGAAESGTAGRPAENECRPDPPLAEQVKELESSGLSRKEAMREAARRRGISRRDVYRAVLEEKERRE